MSLLNSTLDMDGGIEYYKDALLKLIGHVATQQVLGNDLDEYIAVFSLYICKSNEAYRYNLPYLRHQYEKFKSFLSLASNKYLLLKQFMVAIMSSDAILRFVKDNPSEIKKVKISLDRFFAVTLDDPYTVAFHEEFNLSGAEHSPSNATLTVSYNGNIRSCKFSHTSKNETMDSRNSRIIKMIENILPIKDGKQKAI